MRMWLLGGAWLVLSAGCFRGGFATWETAASSDAQVTTDAGPGDSTFLDAVAADTRAVDATSAPDVAAADTASAADAAVHDAAAVDSAGLDAEDSDGALDAGAGDAASPPALEARFTASRLTGVAPLAVFFDASTTSAHLVAEPALDLEYAWDFGDVGTGFWGTTGLPRNQARGVVAAHVYEAPGTYQVSLAVRHGSQLASASATVEVSDPDVVFAGEQTVCASVAGDFTGAPAGCRQMTTGRDFAAVAAELAPGRRLLLRRGETWITKTPLELNQPGPGLLGAFGTGERPRIINDPVSGCPGCGIINLSGAVPQLADWRLVDLALVFQGESTVDSVAVQATGSFTDVLILRTLVDGFETGLRVHGSILDYNNTIGSPYNTLYRGFYVVDSEVSSLPENHRAAICYQGRQGALLGNVATSTATSGSALFELAAEAGVVADNVLRSASTGLLAVDGLDPTSAGVTAGLSGERVVVADNRLRMTGGVAWPLDIRPLNSPDHQLARIAVERNELLGPATSPSWANLSAAPLLFRNNLVEAAGERVCVSLGPGGTGSTASGYRVVHNTCSSPGDDRTVLLYAQPGLSQIQVANNLVASDGATQLLENGSQVPDLSVGNVVGSRAALMAGELCYLAHSSPAIDVADPRFAPALDLYWSPRPADGDNSGSAEPDVGACEYWPTS